jgi:hypothetical protein
MTSIADVDIPELADRSLTEDELADITESESAPVDITFTTQDFDVAGLVTRLNRESMLIPRFGGKDQRVNTAGFQRGFVWNKAQMDRFIESLLLGYPVPGIFLVKQSVDNRMLVLDGQQRLITLQSFYEGLHAGREFKLTNVGEDFQGLTYKTLDEAQRFQLDDSFLQATILQTDGSPQVDEAVYQIFERLNSGGTQLTPHEIRVALYSGPLVDYIEELNQWDPWRRLFGKPSARIRDHELILRTLALFLGADDYSKPLKGFLNGFAKTNRSNPIQVQAAGDLFRSACDAILQEAGDSAFRNAHTNQLNIAQVEALLVATMHCLKRGPLGPDLHARISQIQANPDFIAATTRSTADNDAVSDRLRIAQEIMGS